MYVKRLQKLDEIGPVHETAAAESGKSQGGQARQAEREEYMASLTKYRHVEETLDAFRQEISTLWADIGRRSIGHVVWAPSISVDSDASHYTRDFGVFQVDAKRFKEYKGNVVDLGARGYHERNTLVADKSPAVGSKYTMIQLIEKFAPHDNGNGAFVPPVDRQMRIVGSVSRDELATLMGIDYENSNEGCMIVMQDGNVSGLTIGRYTQLEAYTSSELGIESWQIAIYNEDPTVAFAAPGDSGALVFDVRGRMVGVLHAGARMVTTHVTYATPAWWILESIKAKYPHAEFFRTSA